MVFSVVAMVGFSVVAMVGFNVVAMVFIVVVAIFVSLCFSLVCVCFVLSGRKKIPTFLCTWMVDKNLTHELNTI